MSSFIVTSVASSLTTSVASSLAMSVASSLARLWHHQTLLLRGPSGTPPLCQLRVNGPLRIWLFEKLRSLELAIVTMKVAERYSARIIIGGIRFSRTMILLVWLRVVEYFCYSVGNNNVLTLMIFINPPQDSSAVCPEMNRVEWESLFVFNKVCEAGAWKSYMQFGFCDGMQEGNSVLTKRGTNIGRCRQ